MSFKAPKPMTISIIFQALNNLFVQIQGFQGPAATYQDTALFRKCSDLA